MRYPAGMELTWYRALLLLVALAVATAGLWSRWRSGDLVDTHRDRVLALCPDRLVAAGFRMETDGLRGDMAERWDWGRFELRSDLFADRLSHADERFEAVRASLYRPMPDGPDGEKRCRRAVCLYSVPLDAAIATVRDGACGGSGGHDLVTPGLKPDVLNQQYR